MTGPLLILAWLVIINLFGLLVFAADKKVAGTDKRRVPERTLLIIAALGASPAMIWGTQKLRHKTQKEPFRTLLRAIAVLQAIVMLLAIAWWFGLI
ncbi:MAG: DUF1294 domain-containing protein [Pseudomonadota bacterium]